MLGPVNRIIGGWASPNKMSFAIKDSATEGVTQGCLGEDMRTTANRRAGEVTLAPPLGIVDGPSQQILGGTLDLRRRYCLGASTL